MKTGLILEGGAMRGLFTAGVMDVMMERKLAFSGAIGVSAGAAFGCNYKSGQIGRVLRYNLRFCRDPRYSGLFPLLKTGDLFSKEFCYGQVPMVYDIFDFAAYEKSTMDFYVVCTDVETGLPVYHRYEGRRDHGFDWIRASASMPLVSRIVEIDGQKLLDGGVADSLPLAFFQSLGYEKNVVILTRPAGYVKEKSPALPLVRLKYRAYPAFVRAMETRHVAYNRALAQIWQEAAEGRTFVICPEASLPVKRAEKDPEKLKLAYQAGRAAAKKCWEALEAFLAQ